MGIGCNGSIGRMGDSLFGGVTIDMNILLALHGVSLSVTRYDTMSGTNIYGEPQGEAQTFDALVLLVGQELVEVGTVAGGKRNEVLTLTGLLGTLMENDIIEHLGRKYDVRNVGRTTANSVVVAETYSAVSQVDF